MHARRIGVLTVVATLAAFLAAGPAAAQASGIGAARSESVHVCPGPQQGHASCHAIRNDAAPASTAAPAGYGPADLASAYALPATGGAGQTIAIVDAYDDPTAASDVNAYRLQYGLGPCASTGTNPCFRKVNQSGGTKAPRANGGWAQEISLDLDMASAICPSCHLLLVEANSSSLTDLGTAVNRAAALHATVISNSYGGSESSSDSSYDATYYDHPGIAITASSGDAGYGTEYPAASPYVTAVGGTSLSRTTGTARGWSETAWGSAGSGCSSVDAQPSWQSSTPAITGACGKRAVADVSAVADPQTGVAVYDSTSYQGHAGWMEFGGTSVAAPIIAGVYALAGNAATLTYGSAPYADPNGLNDVTSGSNGSCAGSDLCTAGGGWDGPTGLGSPNGIKAF